MNPNEFYLQLRLRLQLMLYQQGRGMTSDSQSKFIRFVSLSSDSCPPNSDTLSISNY